MIRREWLLGVGLISGGIGAGLAPHPVQAQDVPIGTVAAVKPDAFGAAPNAAEQTLAIGAGLVENEKIRTSADGTANVIFADRSTLTVGKGSEVTLDKFVYDPQAKSGGIALSLTQGALRFVGGQLSKTGDVQVKTPTSTMTIRGGIGLFLQRPDGSGLAVFLYGEELKDETSGQSIFRPGFAFRFPADGGPPELVKITDAELNEILRNFNSQTGVAGSLPDQDIALLETTPDPLGLINDLRDQIDRQSQRNNPALDSLRTFLGTTPQPPVNPYSS
jgi:hypothetical protein